MTEVPKDTIALKDAEATEARQAEGLMPDTPLAEIEEQTEPAIVASAMPAETDGDVSNGTPERDLPQLPATMPTAAPSTTVHVSPTTSMRSNASSSSHASAATLNTSTRATYDLSMEPTTPETTPAPATTLTQESLSSQKKENAQTPQEQLLRKEEEEEEEIEAPETPVTPDTPVPNDSPMDNSIAAAAAAGGTEAPLAKPKNVPPTSKSSITKDGDLKHLPIPRKAPGGRHHLLRGVQKGHMGSPTDKMLSPATEKIEGLRRKHTLASAKPRSLMSQLAAAADTSETASGQSTPGRLSRETTPAGTPAKATESDALANLHKGGEDGVDTTQSTTPMLREE